MHLLSSKGRAAGVPTTNLPTRPPSAPAALHVQAILLSSVDPVKTSATSLSAKPQLGRLGPTKIKLLPVALPRCRQVFHRCTGTTLYELCPYIIDAATRSLLVFKIYYSTTDLVCEIYYLIAELVFIGGAVSKVHVDTYTSRVKTITITPTIPPSGAVVAQLSRDDGFMSHPGKVAGLFVGVALIICLSAAALIWFFIRRKRKAEVETIASMGGGETPQRRQSKMSTIGLLGGTRRSNNRKSVPRIQTSGWGPGNSTEKSPTDTPIDYRRTSYPRVVDQRLEPAALWNPLQDNGSHVSIQSFRDDQDYSRRMLRVSDERSF
ncbi:MAG: hypothetical protein Q9180_003007 [Flavoplaca navasiana]